MTGLGLVTPYGLGVDEFWTGLLASRSCVRRARRFDADGLRTTHVSELPDLRFGDVVEPRAARAWSAATKLAIAGAQLAVRDARLDGPLGGRAGVILGTGYGCVHDFEDMFPEPREHGPPRIHPSCVPKLMPNAPASHVAIEIDARGPSFTVSTACSSSAMAIMLALQQLRSGQLDIVLTGGFDVVVGRHVAAAWDGLRVLSGRNDETACRPFSRDRDGMVLGEGCGILVLERRSHAVTRGAPMRCELLGGAATNDAVDIVRPSLDGQVAAMGNALKDAGVAPEAIAHVNAHGTGTPINDRVETEAIKRVFGAHGRELAVSSIKGHLGHTMGAAGAIEAAATVLAVEHGIVPSTLHHVAGDPGCDLDYVPDGPRQMAVSQALTNSFGFGGQNVSLVVGALR